MRPQPELLGMLFRAVVRRASAPPLPATEGGVWADVLWAVSVLAAGHLAPIDATYSKRWYASSAHRSWPDMYADPRLRLELLPRALQAAPPDARVAALAAGWEQDRLRIEGEATELAVCRARCGGRPGGSPPGRDRPRRAPRPTVRVGRRAGRRPLPRCQLWSTANAAMSLRSRWVRAPLPLWMRALT